MFIRHAHYSVAPGRFDEAVEVFRETVLPELEREGGFMRAILTGDAERGKGILYTMWQTEGHAARYVESGEAQRLLARFGDLLEAPPEVEGYPSLLDREF